MVKRAPLSQAPEKHSRTMQSVHISLLPKSRCMCQIVKYRLFGEPTTAEMWSILKEAHESSGWANRMGLLREFVSLRHIEESSMQAHINNFNKLDENLKDIGVLLTDMLQMTILLASLPPTYENVVNAIESHIEKDLAPLNHPDAPSNPGSPDFAYVTRRLLNEEKRRKLDSGNDSIMLAARYSSRPGPEQVKCYGCGQKGHYRNNCPKNKEDVPSGGDTATILAVVHIESDDESDGYEF